MWRTRINYSFIFELSLTQELKYRDVFLICTMSITAVVGVLFVHLSLMVKGYSYSQVELMHALQLLVNVLGGGLMKEIQAISTNLGKYVSEMLAAGAKVAYEKEKRVGWLCVVVIMSSITTMYQLYWDFVKDWGLLQMNSMNPWLRNEFILCRKFIYFFSMVYMLVLDIHNKCSLIRYLVT
ncbi:hypothetical protein HanLR1_Chr05g0186701 [Helianthus annuus]|nr:hypothetical protein HanLR1_Chr05g0186701 [Helianthus annuus]